MLKLGDFFERTFFFRFWTLFIWTQKWRTIIALGGIPPLIFNPFHNGLGPKLVAWQCEESVSRIESCPFSLCPLDAGRCSMGRMEKFIRNFRLKRAGNGRWEGSMPDAMTGERWQMTDQIGRKAQGTWLRACHKSRVLKELRIGKCFDFWLWWSFSVFPMLSYYPVLRAAWDSTLVTSVFPGLMFFHAVWILRIFLAPNYQLSLSAFPSPFISLFPSSFLLIPASITPQSAPSHKRRPSIF